MEKFNKVKSPDKVKPKIAVRDIVAIALLTAACVVGRTAFQFIPNVQPMTAIFIIISLKKGVFRGMAVAILSLLVTNSYMGMGIWTLSQFIAYFVVILVAWLLGRSNVFQKKLILQVIYACIAGFLYGLVITYVEAQIYGVKAFFPYYLQGISFDFMHAAGNGFFYLILSPIITKMLVKYWPNL